MNTPIQIRRCHTCGEVTESTEDITRCSGCSRSLLPFFYFDRKKVNNGDLGAADIVYDLRPEDLEQGFGPIRGLTVYW